MSETALATKRLKGPKARLPKLPDVDLRHAKAYEMRQAGYSVAEIAIELKSNRTTIWRWIESYKRACREQLETEPVINRIAEKLLKLEAIEKKAMQLYESTKSERTKVAALNQATKAIGKSIELELDSGIIPRDPTRIYSVIQRHKPHEESGGRELSERTPEEILRRVVELWAKRQSVRPESEEESLEQLVDHLQNC